MIRIILFISFFLSILASIEAQELNTKVTINTQKVQVSNREIFKSLENSINELLNGEKWTNTTFNKNERINLSISIAVNEVQNESIFSTEIIVTSRRPVYNSAYQTTLFNFRDTKFSFIYTYGESLNYNTLSISDNLVAVLAYYAYIVIGLDFDSFSQNGGKPYFTKAMEIANSAQTLNTEGWEPFANKNNRYDIAVALTDESMQSFHAIWYKYHRLGLDEMSTNSSRARIRIIEIINDLKELYLKRPTSPLLTIFAEAKLDELVRVCSECSKDEKREIRKILQQIFPTKSEIINNLK